MADDNYSRRLKYSNGQLLAVEDFEAEQNYHVNMRRRHNRLAHTWGILEGLDIEEAQGGMELVIKPGTAIDKDGQEIVLLGPASEPVKLKEKTPPLRDTTFFLALAYDDRGDPDKGPTDKNGKQIYSTRTVESPSIQITAAAPATDGAVITLAKVTVDATGKVKTIDKSVRSRFAGLNPATDLSVRSLMVANNILDDTAFQPLIRILANQKDESPSNAFTESKPSHGIEFFRRWSNTQRLQAGIYAWGTGNLGSGLAFRTTAPGSGASTRMVITDLGNVGVSTTEPKSALSVAGGLAVGANYAKTNAAPPNGFLVEGKVGIGTINPTADLQFRDLVANSNVLICRKAAKNHDEGNVPSELALGTIDSCFAGVRIRNERKGTGNSQYICFDTHDANASAGERMRITPAGNVGIGTAGPRGRLEVSDPAQAGAAGKITSSDKTVTGSGTEFDTKLRVGDQITVGAQVRAITAISSATVLTIDSAFTPDISTATAFNFSRPVLLVKDSSVGIGTTSPGAKLGVGGTLTAAADNEELVGLKIAPTFQDGGKAGVKRYGLIVADGNVGIGTTAPVSKLHIDKGRVDITASDAPGGGKNRFDGLLSWNADANYRRGQLVLSSSYSDLVIASSQPNNIHGSTLTFATSNPTDATDYRKWVINQGNWGTRKQFLDFGYSETKGPANPHDNINNKDTVFTLDGFNKRVGIGTGTPEATLQIGETISHRNKYDLSTSKLLVRGKDHNGGSTPAATQSVLALVREGVADQAYGNMVDFRLGRWEHVTGSNPSRTQLDIYLTEDAFVPKHVMSLRANGSVGIGATGPEAKLDVNGDMIVSGAVKGRRTEAELKAYFKGAKEIPDLPRYKRVINKVATQNATIIQGFSYTAESAHVYALSDSNGSDPGHAAIVDLTTGLMKTFVIDHPLHDDRYLMHATLEGPEGAVYYRGTARLNRGKAQIRLPHYFEALTRSESRTVLLTNLDGFDQLAVLKQDDAKIKNGMFIVVSSNNESNQEFDWEVKAIRKDAAELEVEPLKSLIKVERFGPYAYGVPRTGDRVSGQPQHTHKAPRAAELQPSD